MRIRSKAPRNLADQLGIDLRALGKPVSVKDLTPGEFILAVDETTIASGSIQNITQTGSFYRVSIKNDGTPSYAHLRSPAKFFRVDHDVRTTAPTRFGRLLGDRPFKSTHARSIATILNTSFTPTEIRLSDEGRHVVVQSDTDQTWQRQTIQTVREERSLQVKDQLIVETTSATSLYADTNLYTDTSRLHVIHNSTR